MQRAVTEVIRARSSWRSYDDRRIAAEARTALEAALAAPPAGPFGGRVRLALVENTVAGDGKLGTYGVIRGAREFLVGAVPDGDRAMEDYGYVFEWVLLTATDLGLATCWLGGTFDRGAFGRAVAVASGESMPAVSPVGYAASRRGMIDSVFRFVAGSKKRKPWDALFFDGGFETPLPHARAEDYGETLEMVRLAPSASNKQPWRIVRDAGAWHFYLERTAGYGRLFPVDLQRVDMGIAMCHFALTAREAGLGGEWVDEPSAAADSEGPEYV